MRCSNDFGLRRASLLGEGYLCTSRHDEPLVCGLLHLDHRRAMRRLTEAGNIRELITFTFFYGLGPIVPPLRGPNARATLVYFTSQLNIVEAAYQRLYNTSVSLADVSIV